MGIELEDLEMPQILKLSDELTLLVGFNVKRKEIVIAIGKGGFEDFNTKEHISLPTEAARRTPSFLQDFIVSWDTSHASERVKEILRMEESMIRIGDDPAPSKKRSNPKTPQKKFEDHCEICGKKVSTETSTGWFKLYREGTIIWICPDHDTRETFLFSQER
jgi:hypothetical protein